MPTKQGPVASQAPPGGVRLAAMVLLSCPALFGLVLAGFGTVTWAQVSASSGWPVAQGRILASRVHSSVSTGPPDEHGRSETTITHLVDVTYEYTVAGAAYRGDRYARDGSNYFADAASAQRLVASLPPGAPVEVRYDPADPSQAVLTPGDLSGAQVPLAIGVVMLALCATGLAALIKRGRVPPSAAARVGRTELTSEQHLDNLVVAALADGAIGPEEEGLLSIRAAALGLGDADAVRAAAARVQAQGARVTFHRPTTAHARLATFDMVVLVLRADGKLTSRERRLIEALGQRLDIPPEARARALAPMS